MVASGAALGGEQSGHILAASHGLCGDGVLTALQLATLCHSQGIHLDGWMDRSFQAYPQKLVNVTVPDRARRKGWADCAPLADAVHAAEASMGESGRILVRASGTEPVLRVMVEAERQGDGGSMDWPAGGPGRSASQRRLSFSLSCRSAQLQPMHPGRHLPRASPNAPHQAPAEQPARPPGGSGSGARGRRHGPPVGVDPLPRPGTQWLRSGPGPRPIGSRSLRLRPALRQRTPPRWARGPRSWRCRSWAAPPWP